MRTLLAERKHGRNADDRPGGGLLKRIKRTFPRAQRAAVVYDYSAVGETRSLYIIDGILLYYEGVCVCMCVPGNEHR